jgi:hypothetical protein
MADESDILSPQQLAELKKQELQIDRERLKVEREIQDLKDKGLQVEQSLIDKRTELTNKTDDLNRKMQASSEAMQDITERAEAQKDAFDALKVSAAAVGASLTGLTGQFDKLYGTNLTALTGIESGIAAISQYATEIQGLHVDLRRATGFQDRYTKSFDRLKGAYQKMGLPQEVLHRNLIDLNKNFAAFDSKSKDQRDNITLLAAKYVQLGSDGAGLGKVLDELEFSFGMVGNASAAAASDFTDLRKETGISMDVLVEGFTSLSGELARFGKAGPKVFADLQKRARSLGMTVQDAFNITDQLDTFQGAAEITGRLNAQFGMQLNSVELMKASHEERLDILRQEFAMQGTSFQNLDRRQKQMIASIFGRDVGTVARMFGEGMDLASFQEDLGKKDDLTKTGFNKQTDRMIAANEGIYDATVLMLGGQAKIIELQSKLLDFIEDNKGGVAQGLMGMAAGGGILKMAGAGAGAFLTMALTRKIFRAAGTRGVVEMLSKSGGAKGKLFSSVLRLMGAGATAAGATAAVTGAGAGTASRIIAAANQAGVPRGMTRTASGLLVPSHLAAPTGAKVAGEATELAGKTVAKTAATGGAKMGGKLIPGIGLGLALMDATSRLGRGDFVGAGIDVLAGVAGLKPGLGTAASIGLMGVNLARDANRMNQTPVQQSAQATAMAPGSSGARMDFSDGTAIPIRVVIDELVVQSKLFMDSAVIDERINKRLAVERP